MRRHDGVLPTVTERMPPIPIALADGNLLAPEGLDRERGIQFLIQDEATGGYPAGPGLPPREQVKAAMEFLCDEWLVDVARRPCRQGDDHRCRAHHDRALAVAYPAVLFRHRRAARWGKTTTLIILIMAVTGSRPAAAAWSTNEEERRKALMSYFLSGAAYILWDNIARGTETPCPHIEKSCTSAYYSDRKLGVSEMVRTAASTIHFFTGNNIGPCGDLASRSLHIRLDVDRVDPENRPFKHPDPIGWTENIEPRSWRRSTPSFLGIPSSRRRGATRRARPDLKCGGGWSGRRGRDAAKLARRESTSRQSFFITQEEDDEVLASLADVARCPGEDMARRVHGGTTWRG